VIYFVDAPRAQGSHAISSGDSPDAHDDDSTWPLFHPHLTSPSEPQDGEPCL